MKCHSPMTPPVFPDLNCPVSIARGVLGNKISFCCFHTFVTLKSETFTVG